MNSYSFSFVLRIWINSGNHYYTLLDCAKPCKNPRDRINFYLAMLQLYKLRTSYSTLLAQQNKVH